MKYYYYRCPKGHVFCVGLASYKHLNNLHENPKCRYCESRVTVKTKKFQYTEFHKKYCKKIDQEIKKLEQLNFGPGKGLIDNPKFQFLWELHDEIWDNKEEYKNDQY